eukprot:TRINITY_DN9102_c0_g1_i1.p1 TRINITY_DN9102_c0_g1~~TRINITY_DN9102_c0_g1_i1.p1  ORF type:complete len:353 (-),score=88.19 TRINITY_DN9102_c0_g1_i1:22-1080(-)
MEEEQVSVEVPKQVQLLQDWIQSHTIDLTHGDLLRELKITKVNDSEVSCKLSLGTQSLNITILTSIFDLVSKMLILISNHPTGDPGTIAEFTFSNLDNAITEEIEITSRALRISDTFAQLEVDLYNNEHKPIAKSKMSRVLFVPPPEPVIIPVSEISIQTDPIPVTPKYSVHTQTDLELQLNREKKVPVENEKDDEVIDNMVKEVGRDYGIGLQKVKSGVFMVGTKKLNFQILHGYLVVRVGGGFMQFDDWFKKYGHKEGVEIRMNEGNGVQVLQNGKVKSKILPIERQTVKNVSVEVEELMERTSDKEKRLSWSSKTTPIKTNSINSRPPSSAGSRRESMSRSSSRASINQ